MPLAADAVAALTAKGLTLATAEATTGGLIGHLITDIPGSSRVFRGGVAPYGNAMKRAIGVPAALLAEHGAVSREAAEALATAVREWAGADIGLAETGIAGPVLRLSAAADAQDERPRPSSPPPAGLDRPAGLSGSRWPLQKAFAGSASSSTATARRTGRPARRRRCECSSKRCALTVDREQRKSEVIHAHFNTRRSNDAPLPVSS